MLVTGRITLKIILSKISCLFEAPYKGGFLEDLNENNGVTISLFYRRPISYHKANIKPNTKLIVHKRTAFRDLILKNFRDFTVYSKKIRIGISSEIFIEIFFG